MGERHATQSYAPSKMELTVYDLIPGLVIQSLTAFPTPGLEGQHVVLDVKRDHKNEEVNILTDASPRERIDMHFTDKVLVTGTVFSMCHSSEGEAKSLYPELFRK